MSTDRMPFLSPIDYLRIERSSETRSEYFRGQMHAIAGRTGTHSALAQNVGSELRVALKGKGCLTFNSDMRIHIPSSGHYTYADGSVAYEAPLYLDAANDTLLNPILLFDVLSPSTKDYDRGGKFAQYRTIPSLREYLTVSQDRVAIEQWALQNEHWTLTDHTSGGIVFLEALGVSISLDEVYRDITLS